MNILRVVVVACIMVVLCPSISMGLGWVLPTGYNDPGNTWSRETQAYDGDKSDGSFAQQDGNPGSGWGTPLEFTLSAPIKCGRVGLKSDFGDPDVDSIRVELFNGSWTNVYEGVVPNMGWTEPTFVAVDNVTGARFTYHYKGGNYMWWLYEFELYEEPAVILDPSCATDAAISVEETSAIIQGHVVGDGGAPCVYRFIYGTVSGIYPSNTVWSTPTTRASGQGFSTLLTGLVEGQTYYYKAEVQNSVNTKEGNEISFLTRRPESVGWVSPTGVKDPGGSFVWSDMVAAHDGDIVTTATCYHNIGDGQWSDFLYLDHADIECDGIRFYALGPPMIDLVDADVLEGAVWVDVYDGILSDRVMDTHMFTQAMISGARVRFHISSSSYGTNWELFEVEFHRCRSAIGTVIILE